MEREAIEATSLILKSRIPKIGCNIKFENNWTKTHLGHNVKNWWFDTMVAAHVLDNRKGITSAKFQAFVQLGQPSYNDHIEPYLKGKMGLNKIHELDLDDLLLYNGLDSLLEYKVAMIQMKQLKKRKII
jgi:DNA polymerase I-like protein with 3'-5' exonuclease and polymerase domains